MRYKVLSLCVSSFSDPAESCPASGVDLFTPSTSLPCVTASLFNASTHSPAWMRYRLPSLSSSSHRNATVTPASSIPGEALTLEDSTSLSLSLTGAGVSFAECG
ncbi:hypothetical protein PIB30_083035 [Stylosanthes scabra]|uniref:Secreted protein n=1 Tax=Stylosanthes scabra TaxID=79078 RepID=A0ABU6VQN3_9FABA|nr:hypothetical protein [Stylosanthes scabra]